MAKRAKNNSFIRMNQEAMLYCFRNNFKVYPRKNKDGTYNISVEKGDKVLVSDSIYNEKDLQQAIWDTFEKIYAKQKAK